MASRVKTGLFNEKSIRIFLVVYRGFALVLPVTLFSIGYFRIDSWPQWFVIGAASVYTLFKVARPLHQYKNSVLRHIDFALDLAICLSLPVFTGGLQSPFLLFCLSPLLTSALLFSKKLTFSVSTLPVISVVVSQLLFYQNSTAFFSQGLSLGLLGIYLASSILFAWLPYATNINASNNILAQAVIEERKRLSRDVHDGVSQSLWIIRWKLEQLGKVIIAGDVSKALNNLTEILQTVEYSQQELKELTNQLRRTVVDNEQGFVPILAQYTTDFTRDYGIDCELYFTDGKVNLNPLAELELLCVAQEALTNVKKHAEANRVQVTFEANSSGVEMVIKDNGRGFETEHTGHGHGLAVMEERIKSIGGQFSINSKPGSGAEVKITLPAP